MSKNRNIIDSKSFLGFKFYERIRVSTDEIEIDKSILHQSNNYNLTPLWNLNNYSFSLFEIRDETILRHALEEIVVYTFINLLLKEHISIIKYQDKKKYLGGLYSESYVSFYCKIISEQKLDYVSNILLYSIIKTEEKYNLKSDLKKLINEFNNCLLGIHEINNPIKKLLELFLSNFSMTHSWLNLEVKNKKLFLPNSYKIKIEKEYLEVLESGYNSIQEIRTQLEKIDSFKIFVNQFLYLFIDDLDERIPISETDSD